MRIILFILARLKEIIAVSLAYCRDAEKLERAAVAMGKIKEKEAECR